MKLLKVRLGFTSYAKAELIAFARGVLLKMTGNAGFPAPDIAMKVIEAAVNLFEQHHIDSITSRSKQSVASAKESRKALEKLLHTQAEYVNRIADGNETIILSSGFETTKQPAAKERPMMKISSNTEHGQVVIQCKAVKGAVSYIYQYAQDSLPATDDLWHQAGVSAQSKFVIENLKSDSHVWFRYAAITRKGQEAWSEPMMKFVA
jgi:hypothetical protein